MKSTSENQGVEEDSLFIEIPIDRFSEIQAPCLNVEIENTIYSVELNLGFQGHLALFQDIVNCIQYKKEMGKRMMYGIRNKYLNTLYKVPKIKIGDLAFFNINLQGEGK